nr:hypothetical protein [uncultured Mediterranean phage uvMED]BAR16836.1 hypothetical protein [uncultured Mediterranean phage uvMED]BAR16938.1 hypothetical protein [uncultured Mediterranean phage uvMED]BAR16977.1 hypothetical protein [uncultured Mediterranean phage uvMED]BAR17105.1 hypothetical protein [uncultured Mediterranean phage uvMED]
MSKARDKANSTVSNFASTGIDDNADATAITIDSSENVLVGTTNTDPAFNNVTGQSMAASGQFQVTRDGGTAALFNRKSSDGEIVSIRKDGTTVGSIGASGGRPYFSNGTESIRLAGGSFEPANATGGASDNTYDLGVSGARWKNLYLSGGAYLGGTGSANKLDDYEEGTFNPTFQQGISVTSYSAQNGRYTKVGRLVTAEIDLDVNVGSVNTSHLYIGGLPFTSLSSAPYGVGVITYNGGWYNASFTFQVLANTTFLAAYRQSDGGAVGGNDLTDFDATIRVTAIYMAA